MDQPAERRDSVASYENTDNFPHGTLRLERRRIQFTSDPLRLALTIDSARRKQGEIILHPIPSSDRNDPLNREKWYKALQFALVSFYTLMVFVNVDIGTVSWGPLNTDLGISLAVLTGSFGLCCAGLAVGCHGYQPLVIIATFPAITYSALMYGSILSWSSVLVNAWSMYFILPPYKFSASGTGLMNLPPFIGWLIGSFYGGLLNDWMIVKLARRHKGIFEPEMRLWVALPAVLALPASILLFGLATANCLPWILPCIGSDIFGFAMVTLGDVGLTYAMDCYIEIIGDALVGVCFIRNLFATIISVTLTYWIEGVGLSNMIIMSAVLAFALSVTTVPMLMYRKRARIWTEVRRKKMTARQFESRG